MTHRVDSELTQLPGIGQAVVEKLKKLSIIEARDFFFHLPRAYQDRTHLCPLANIRAGQQVLVEGKILSSKIAFGRRRMLLVQIEDEHGVLLLRFFHFNQGQHRQFQQSESVRCFGEVRLGPQGYEMVHPEYKLLRPGVMTPLDKHLTPLYSTTDGVSQTRLRQWIIYCFERYDQFDLHELLPKQVLDTQRYPDLRTALTYLHFPPVDADLHQLLNGDHPTQKRLAFEELLAHRLSLRQLRTENQADPAAPCPASTQLVNTFLQQLPYALTNAQNRVIHEISTDLSQPHAMMRLLQGDVGAGKTVVAMIAMLQVVEAGYQAALMAPTEILAAQHVNTLQTWLEPLGIRVGLLISKLKASEKKAILADIESGQISIVIGTHALIQKTVQFQQLGLIVIDEQHRFGVEQRKSLQQKHHDLQPHQLIMTATPIPRTLAMTSYADLDVSKLDELPPGREPVTTILINQQRRDDITNRITHVCQKGQQVYWVCTLIEESEALTCQAAEEATKYLQQQLPNLKVGLVHGQLKSSKKQEIMDQFVAGTIEILVATTVIEVGVNVPNASLMVIENPERLGLAQLHQLRGRVGRGNAQSFCVLLYQTPLSNMARARLETMRETNDGFLIAEKDLELRGPGEVLGTRQTGEMQFRLANLGRDQHLLPDIQTAADELLQKHPGIVKQIIQRWIGSRLSLGKI